MDIELRLPNTTSTLQIIGCHFGTKPQGWHYERHHHFLFELIYCLEGNSIHQIDDQVISLEAGQWLLIKSGIPHETRNDSPELYRFFNVHFDLDDPQLRALLYRSNYAIMNDQAAVIILTSIEKELMTWNDSQSDALEGSLLTLRVQSHIMQLILTFAQELLLQIPSTMSKDSMNKRAATASSTASETDIAREIESRLRDKLYHKGSIGEIASHIGLSRSQCTKIFSRVYGQSPRQYVTGIILNQAKQLLVYSTKTVEQIAEELGFESASHFSRQFRRWTGMAPTHYRPRLPTAAGPST
ncbi:MAG: helix-turn-helix domain-containing protein [Candidatus Pristimantibacillus sp.]